MKKLSWAIGAVLGAITISICIPSLVTAQANASNTEYKIGVVDIDVASREYAFRKDKMETLRGQYKERSNGIEEDFSALQSRREGIRERRGTLSEDERFELQLGLEDEFHDLQQQLARLAADKAWAQERLELVISRDIQSTLDMIAFEENYHLILAVGEGVSSGVLYASSTVNMTPKLIDRMNEAYLQ